MTVGPTEPQATLYKDLNNALALANHLSSPGAILQIDSVTTFYKLNCEFPFALLVRQRFDPTFWAYTKLLNTTLDA